MLKIKTCTFENEMTRAEAAERYLEKPGHSVYLLENGKQIYI